jgi:hypothetical protein
MQKAPAETTVIRINSVLLYKPAPIVELYTGIVDKFGQNSKATWPSKIAGESDLAARLASENADIAAKPEIPGRDEYGALAKDEKLPATGFFRTAKRDGKWWLVAPNGHLFLSFGFNGMWPGGNPDESTNDTPTVTQGREYMFQVIKNDVHASKSKFHYGPFKAGLVNTYDFYGANVDRKYGAKYGSGDYVAGWNAQTFKRMRSWGFNTIGNWSDTRAVALQTQDKAPYTVRLGSVSPSNVVRVPDPYDPGFAPKTDALIRSIITPQIASDPWCLGYYCDNEIKWSTTYPQRADYASNVKARYSLAIAVLAAGPAQPAKAGFQEQMRKKYGTIESLNKGWGTTFGSWEAFLNPYMVPGSPREGLVADMGSFTRAYASLYATTIKKTIARYDPNHLYLGCRFSFASTDIVQGVAGDGGCDVVSFNIYSRTLDPVVWSSLSGLNKPCIVSEYHFGAQDSGNVGYGNGTDVRCANQGERAERYMTYMKSLLAMPMFVGAHWFQYNDEPLTGRNFDGEDYNIGFVDVADTPYQGMVDAARQIHSQAYTLHEGTATQ